MSQLPEMPAADWPEQGYDPSLYARPEHQPPAPGAAPPQAAAQPRPDWQNAEPDWAASQQSYPARQAYPGAPQQGYPEADAESGLPTEFDHLFRDSTPDSRRAIDRQKPVVGGAAPGYLNAAQAAEAASAEAGAEHAGAASQSASYHQQAPQPPFGRPAERYQGSAPENGGPYQGQQFESGQYQGPAQFQSGQYQQPQSDAGHFPGGQYPQDQYQGGQYQGAQFQPGPYGQPGYQEAPGYGAGGGGYGGGYDGGGTGAPARAGRNRKVLIIGGAALVAAAIGVGVLLSSSDGSPGDNRVASPSLPSVTAKAAPKQQADRIYALIQESEQLRSDANTGVIDVNDCKDLAAAQTLLSGTAQKRQGQSDAVAKLDVSAIQDGAQLAAQLKAAWTASALYDSAYAQIAGDLQGNCKAGAARKDPNYQTVNQQASAADDAKAQAARLWNGGVAAPLGEPQVSAGKL